MLESIDILVGLAVVMLFLSMPVTLLTQFFNDLLNQRGAFLKQGVAELLNLVDSDIDEKVAKVAANVILRHELVTGRWFGFFRRRVANEVHREELTKLILSFAAGGVGFPADLTSDQKAAQTKVTAALAANGIADPAAALSDIRMAALKLEQSNPEMANSARQSQAILLHAESQFVAKINSWFDQTIDRVSDRFTAVTRFVTVIAAVIVALALQVDSVGLINRLATDEATRTKLVEAAYDIDKAGEPPKTDDAWLARLNKAAGVELLRVPNYQIKTCLCWPAIEVTILEQVTTKDPVTKKEKIETRIKSPELTLGILLTVAFLSLGAPFWYELLKSLLKLRSLVAAKDDEDRRERQTTQGAGAGGAATPAGERGDLGAQG